MKEVAGDLASRKLDPDEFMIRFVELPNGQKRTLNNREFAV
ncbi:hypothetical protein [Tenacibaculum maritimum]|nr:hypothetical protein [Tenacibaculum maritimum]